MIDYAQLMRHWDNWFEASWDNRQLIFAEAPELERFNAARDYCGPSWHPHGRLTARRIIIGALLNILGALVPDTLFGIRINLAGFWHDRLYLVGGSMLDRLWADCLFLAIIWDQIYQSDAGARARYAAYLAGWWYFLAVRALGWAAFKYH